MSDGGKEAISHGLLSISNWLPAVVYMLVNLLMMAAGAFALRSKWKSDALEESSELSEIRRQKIEVLEQEVATLKSEVAVLRVEMQRNEEMASASRAALEAQIAELQKNERDANARNLELQRKLDAAEKKARKHEAQHVE